MVDFAQKSDEELVELSLKNQSVFYELMKRYETKFLLYILRLGKYTKEDAEDILQEAYIKIYTNLNSFDKNLKFSSWGYRIVHNETISRFRKYKNKNHIYLEDVEWENFTNEFDLQEYVAKKLDKQLITKVLEVMDLKYREILILKFLEQKSYEEISYILGKPLGTVATLVNRAKKIFKNKANELDIKFNF